MYIFCCGMRRSASTLQYQLTKEIVELSSTGKGYGWRPNQQSLPEPANHYQVVKCHAYIPVDGKAIYIHRNIKDVIVSSMNMWGWDFNRALQELPAIVNEKKQWTSRDDILISKYEDILTVNGIKKEIKKIGDYLYLDISFVDIDKLAEAHTIKMQQKKLRSSSFPVSGKVSKTEYNPESLLHKNHIQSGKVGQWKIRLTKEQIKRIDDYL